VRTAAHYDVLIVGAGHGGAQAAVSLRQRKYTGTVALVGEEKHPPYERPPLSKEYLSGERTFERMLLRPMEFWREREVELISGCKAVAVDASAHEVRLEDGTQLHYDKLIWATGGQPIIHRIR
jgi:3-phenylpropionate/trans-cinnamate dioxygenase ferredoxin reductase subunit